MLSISLLVLLTRPVLADGPEGTGSVLWWEEYDDAEARVGPLLHTWDTQARNATRALASDTPSVERLQSLRSKRGVLATERELLLEARRLSNDRAQDREGRKERCTFRVSGLRQEIDTAADETTAAFDAARLSLVGVGNNSAERAMQRWWAAFREVNWERAWAAEDGLDALVVARRSLDEAAAGLRGDDASAIQRLLFEADAEERSRLSLWRLSTECASLLEEPLEATNLGAMESRITEIGAQLTELEEQISTLEHRLSASETVEGANGLRAQLAGLDLNYTHLADGLDGLDRPVSAQTWCSVLVHGALVRLAVHGADADDLLQTAVASRAAVCHNVMAEWLDVPLFQSAWSMALFKAYDGANATMRLQLDSGAWSIDGLPVEGLNVATVDLRPGLHRVEHMGSTGRFQFQMVPLLPGDRLVLSSVPERTGPAGIQIDTYEDLISSGPMPDVPGRLRDPDGPGTIVQPTAPPPRKLSVFVSPVWVSLLDAGHAGGTLQVGWRLYRASWMDLELGLAHDQAMGPEPYRYTKTGASSPFLFRERATLTIRGGATWPLRPLIELSGGTIPLNAGLVSGQAGLELPLNDRLFLAGYGSLAMTFWRGMTTAIEPAAALGVGARL